MEAGATVTVGLQLGDMFLPSKSVLDGTWLNWFLRSIWVKRRLSSHEIRRIAIVAFRGVELRRGGSDDLKRSAPSEMAANYLSALAGWVDIARTQSCALR